MLDFLCHRIRGQAEDFMKENFGNKMPEDHIPFAKIQPLFDQQDRVKGETSIWLLTVLRYGY
jgi:hypothetical protein